MDRQKEQLIFVTGYFGADIRGEAERIAAGKGRPVLLLDPLIEEADGRSIARLCMMGGEHAYRNAEYEQVGKICREYADRGYAGQEACDDGEKSDDTGPLPVVACGDGILYDEDTRAMILQHTLVIAGEDMEPEDLWERARQDETTWHAFMKFGTEEEKRRAFEAHHERQRKLFDEIRQSEIGDAV